MKHLSRDTWLAIALVVILFLVTVAAAISQTQKQSLPALSSASADPNGAKALRLWLDNLGYTTRNDVAAVFGIPENSDLVLLLEPSTAITTSDWEEIDSWLDAGGTLVLAGDSWETLLAARHFNFLLTYLDTPVDLLTVQTPLMTSPPLEGDAKVQTKAYFQTERQDFVTHLAVPSGPVLISFEQGAGRVILSAAPFPFSNAGLKETGNPALVLNVIAASHPGQAWFDEWHHGLRLDQGEVVGPEQWLRDTPAGRALLYTALVIFLALVLQGRGFGRPVLPSQESSRRAPLEYITAIANLNRRAGHRGPVLEQYSQRLKRQLGKRYHLDPSLPDKEYVAELSRLRPKLDAEALLSLLTRLHQSKASESELIQLARQASEWLSDGPDTGRS